MIPYLGDFTEDDTVYLMFNTFSSDDPSASCTITNFINTDVHIHKDDGLTDRNNAAGITVSVNFDSITGSHMIKIDTNDNTVAGFWVTGHDYFVRIEGTTVDGATINSVVGHFSIENRYTRGTDSANTTTPPTVGAIRTEIEGAGTKLSEVLTDTGTTLPGSITSLNDISVADIIAGIADGSLDLQEMLRVIVAATAGKSSGFGTANVAFRDYADTKDRITATVDSTGNRTAITLDGA